MSGSGGWFPEGPTALAFITLPPYSPRCGTPRSLHQTSLHLQEQDREKLG